MAHELEFVNGTASTFSVGETPWHKEGHLLVAAPSFDEAIRLARLDYTVEKIRTFAPSAGGVLAPTGAYITRRTDTQKELGVVGEDYAPVQNLDGFRVLEPLLDQGVLSLETGGVLRDGADAWLLGKWEIERFGPITREVFGHEVVPYALLALNHSGRRGILGKKTNVRVVCANTLGFAEGGKGEQFVIRHTGDAQEKLVEAANELFNRFVEEYEALAGQYRQLKQTFLTDAEFRELVVRPIAVDPRSRPEFNPEARLAEKVVERYENKVAELERLWVAGKGHTGDHSAWEAYNAAVEAIDHNRELWPSRSGSYRLGRLMTGDLAKMKDTVLNNLVARAA